MLKQNEKLKCKCVMENNVSVAKMIKIRGNTLC